MGGKLGKFNQHEYSRVLDEHGGRKLTQTQCEKILMGHGASFTQAKNGAYTYLHHGNHIEIIQREDQGTYNRLLDEFDGTRKSNMECIHYLEKLGYSQGQAKNAVYKYRLKRGLIK
jgi:hypothetical protein